MNNLPATNDASNAASPHITMTDGHARTSSIAVAQFFGKRHNNVLRAIDHLDCTREFSLLNYEQRDFVDERGKTRRCYEMTKDGFYFLTLRFRGPSADAWCERYIHAFNAMESKLHELSGQTDHERKLRRDLDAQAEHLLNEAIPGRRQLIYAGMMSLGRQLGEPVPPIEDFPPRQSLAAGIQQSEHHHLGVKFWQVVRELVAQNHPINHAAAPGCCALNMPSLRGLARLNGYHLGRNCDLKAGLHAIDTPAFIGPNHSVKSVITGKSTRCWVFETDEFDDTPARRKTERARVERLAGLRD